MKKSPRMMSSATTTPTSSRHNERLDSQYSSRLVSPSLLVGCIRGMVVVDIIIPIFQGIYLMLLEQQLLLLVGGLSAACPLMILALLNATSTAPPTPTIPLPP
jgi:hypothetical protein